MSAAKITAAPLVVVALTSAVAQASPSCKVRVNPYPGNPGPIYTNPWHFGMSVQLQYTQFGQGLRVYNVTPYSPAARAGLEPGDIILAANHTRFGHVRTNQEGVALLQQAVNSYGHGAPAPTATTTLASAHINIAPPVVQTSNGHVQMQVLDVRTGQVVWLNVYPESNGFGGGPAPTATFTR